MPHAGGVSVDTRTSGWFGVFLAAGITTVRGHLSCLVICSDLVLVGKEDYCLAYTLRGVTLESQ